MSTTKRRIVALERASQRRERKEPDLRAALEARRRERMAAQAQADEAAARVAQLEAVAADHRLRIARMMTGEARFSLDDFEACRRYLEIVDAQTAQALADLDAQRAAVAAKDAEADAARRAIALNRGRIDVCRARAKTLANVLEAAALDAEDEAAEEQTLARRRHA